jgi:hypothetical protein
MARLVQQLLDGSVGTLHTALIRRLSVCISLALAAGVAIKVARSAHGVLASSESPTYSATCPSTVPSVWARSDAEWDHDPSGYSRYRPDPTN